MRSFASMILVFLVCASVHALGADSERSFEKVGPILNAVLPDWEVQGDSAGGVTGLIGGKRMPLEIRCITSLRHEGQDVLVMVVAVPQEEKKLAMEAEAGRLQPNMHAPLKLVAGVAGRQSRGVAVDLEDAALASSRLSVDVRDYWSDGELEVGVRGLFTYWSEARSQATRAERLLMFRLPDLQKVLALTEKLVITSRTGMEKRARKVEFVDGGKGGPRKLRFRDEDTGNVEEVDVPREGTPYLDAPRWNPVAPTPSSKQKSSTLTLRIMDSRGRPIQNAHVAGERMVPTLFGRDGGRREKLESVTGPTGQTRLDLPSATALSVKADGYYTWRKTLVPGDAPGDTLAVTLERLDAPVDMRVRNLKRRWSVMQQRIELGVDLNGGADGSGGGFTVDKEKACLWIEVLKIAGSNEQKTGDAPKVRGENREEWYLRLTGLHGWQLAPGAIEASELNDASLRRAPVDGYSPVLEGRGDQLPQAIFVRSADGRYGKFAPLKFGHMTGPGYTELLLWAMYAVQSHPCGTQSLNPKAESAGDQPQNGGLFERP